MRTIPEQLEGETPRLDGATLSPLTLLLTASGTIGDLLFALVWLIEGATRPGYDAWAQPISALSLGPGGWVQRTNFIVLGVLLVLAALGWRRVLARGIGGVLYPVLRAVEGVALVMDGVFSQDPGRGYPPGAVLSSRSLHGKIHLTFAFIAFTAIALGWFVLARRLRVESRWRGWAVYAVLTGCLVILFIALFSAGGPGGFAGLLERLSTLASLPLSLLIIGRLVFQARSHHTRGS